MQQPDATTQLQQAERSLEDARQKLVVLQVSEATASQFADTYATWRADRDAVMAEIDRLTNLIVSLKANVEEEATRALQRRVDARDKANELLAQRIRKEGQSAIDALRSLLRDVAAAAAEDAVVNALLPPGAQRILSADAMARTIPATPREDVAEEVVERWVIAGTGERIADEHQGRVSATSSTLGKYGTWDTPCARRKFKAVDYLDEVAVQRAEPLVLALRLANCDGPGFAWNGDILSHPARALQMLSQPAAIPSPERKKLREYTPLEPWAPPPEAALVHGPVGRREGSKAETDTDQ